MPSANRNVPTSAVAWKRKPLSKFSIECELNLFGTYLQLCGSLNGPLLLVERVYLLQEGQLDTECVLLVNADGMFVSRITYVNAQSAAATLGGSAHKFLSPGDARFDLVRQAPWKLV